MIYPEDLGPHPLPVSIPWLGAFEDPLNGPIPLNGILRISENCWKIRSPAGAIGKCVHYVVGTGWEPAGAAVALG